MVPTMILAAALALTFVVLVVRQLYPPRDSGDSAAGRRPTIRFAARFGQLPNAVPFDLEPARAESDVVQRLVRGELSHDRYQTAMADLAGRDATGHQLDEPASQ